MPKVWKAVRRKSNVGGGVLVPLLSSATSRSQFKRSNEVGREDGASVGRRPLRRKEPLSLSVVSCQLTEYKRTCYQLKKVPLYVFVTSCD